MMFQGEKGSLYRIKKENSHRTFNIAIQFTLNEKRIKKQNRRMNNFGLAGKMGWMMDSEKKEARKWSHPQRTV